MSEGKADPLLGMIIKKILQEKGVETPTSDSSIFNSDYQKIESIEINFRNIMKMLNLDLSDDSLKETPRRFAKMLVYETMWGLDYNNFPKCTTVENRMLYDEMVTVKDITVHSVCEHHFQNFDGYATIAYIPHNKILGLSKFPRIVDFFSRRPQIQERLTEQIFYALNYILETDNIAVAINAEHSCVRNRGIRDQNSSTITSRLGGVFKENPSAKAEFMAFFNSK